MLNNYITYRKKYLLQNKENYVTVFANVNDWNLMQHIKGKSTLGIFVSNISKFLTFDIDIKVNKVDKKQIKQYQKWVLYKTIEALNSEGIGQYNISFSGNKGYHVDLIFDKPIRTTVLKELGKYIINKYELNNITDIEGKLIAEVELRGCNSQGVKLPLGFNRKTNKYMYYLDEDLEPVSVEKFKSFELKILNSEVIYNLHSVAIDEIEEINTKDIILIKSNNKGDNKPLEYSKSELDFIIQNEMLKNKGTRNDFIYLVALWCNSHKLSKDEAVEKLYRIIDNTPSELYNDLTSTEWKYKECERVANKVYANNLVLFDLKEVGLNKALLEFIMQSCKTLKQMNIFLTHIYHYLKWGNDEGIYFLSENRICEYSKAKKRDTVIKLNKELIDLGILEVVEKGRYIDLGNGMKKGIATTYKLTIPKDLLVNTNFTIKNDKIDFIKVSAKYLDKKTILKYIPKKTYYRNFQ